MIDKKTGEEKLPMFMQDNRDYLKFRGVFHKGYQEVTIREEYLKRCKEYCEECRVRKIRYYRNFTEKIMRELYPDEYRNFCYYGSDISDETANEYIDASFFY